MTHQHLSIYLPTYLPAYPTYPPSYLSTYSPHLPLYLYPARYLSTLYSHPRWPAMDDTSTLIYLSTYLPTYLPTLLPIYPPSYLPPYLTYLSTSPARYLSTLYSHPRWPEMEPREMQSELMNNIDKSLMRLLGPYSVLRYLNCVLTKRRQGQPVSFTDFFGHMVGETLLKEVGEAVRGGVVG